VRAVAVTLVAALAVADCGSSAVGAVPEGTHTLSAHLAGAMKKCWFSGDAAFAPYRYTPEVNAGVPRILVVSRKEPNGRPLLVVEPIGTITANAYGPLLAGKLSQRIQDDLRRWLKGGSDCN
jgi:hypothetical protein